MRYLPAIFYGVSLLLPAFVCEHNGKVETVYGFLCLLLSVIGSFGYIYCWANWFMLLWIGLIPFFTPTTVRNIAGIVLSILAVASASTFLWETQFPLDEGGVNMATITTYHFGFYFWYGSCLTALIISGRSLTKRTTPSR